MVPLTGVENIVEMRYPIAEAQPNICLMDSFTYRPLSNEQKELLIKEIKETAKDVSEEGI